MAKQYLVQFGVGNPTLRTGLTPTFVIFKAYGGSLISAPGITELPSSSGLYYFSYAPTMPISFLVDGGSAIADDTYRYVSGTLDPIQAVDEKVGTLDDSFGSTSVVPTTIFGYVKRLFEFNEGNSTFSKTSGLWNIFSRGSSTQLAQKTLADTSSTVTKS